MNVLRANVVKQGRLHRFSGCISSALTIFCFIGFNPIYAATTGKKEATTNLSSTLANPARPTTCTSLKDFATTDCQLTWKGIRLYGTLDYGAGWLSHGSSMSPISPQGQLYLIQKANNESRWGRAPNAMSQSNIGIKGTEAINPKLDAVFDVEAGFNPYTFRLANGPRSVRDNAGIPLDHQDGLTDSSRAGQFYNSVGYVGFSSKTYGTLTFFRQNTLTLDGVGAYDPMSTSYAFSPIEWSGMTAGGGNTENTRATMSAKYRLDKNPIRLAAFWQLGGYQWNNAATNGGQGQIGVDIATVCNGTLSFDAIGSYFRNSVSNSLAGAPLDSAGQPVPPFLPQVYTATLSNNSSAMGLAKYSKGALKLFLGYEWIRFARPSKSFANHEGFRDISGTFVCSGCTAINNTNISTTAFGVNGLGNKYINISWIGAKYTVAQNVDIIGAYYNYYQPSYFGTAAKGRMSCSGREHAQCSGSMNAISAAVDWTIVPKFDLYAGAMYSQVNGGLANGYLNRRNIDPTIGIRIRV